MIKTGTVLQLTVAMAQEFDFVGFGWFLGWNDGCSGPCTDEYEANLVNRLGPPGVVQRPCVSHSRSFLCGAFGWARRALNCQKRRFPAPAVIKDVRLEFASGLRIGPAPTLWGWPAWD
jgi:hypothetical protein